MDYRDEAPELLRNFLTYHETVRGHSKKTVDEYFLDLRTFFRFLKKKRGLAPDGAQMEDISISDVDIDFVRKISLTEVYDYLSYLARERPVSHRGGGKKRGLSATSRARKIATIRSFFKYLTVKAKLLETNPVADLDSPKTIKSLPRHLTLEESKRLLSSVDGKSRERDFCILTLFLNCGLRISELVGLDLDDVRSDSLRIRGKGGKERIVYLNDACAEAINAYLESRRAVKGAGTRALFLSSRRARISKSTVHHLVKKHLSAAALDSRKYSSHKLRHTAATLLLKSGVDVRTLQELLGHEHLNTTQIYAHVESDSLRRAALLSPLSGFRPKKTEEEE